MGCNCSTGFLIKTEKGCDDIRKYYKIGKLLGSGSFGQVRECLHRESGETFAVKILERKTKEKGTGRPSNEAMIKSEVDILKDLDHPHIINFFDFFEDKHFLYAVLEKCDGGELFYQIVRRRKFTEDDAAALCKEMLGSLEYLHARSIVHRDVKAENFLFKGKSPTSSIKLIDFGMSARLLEGDVLTDLCGSPHYISPEIIRKRYNCKADMWAFGVMIYLMLFGRYPFEGPKPADIAREIVNKDLDWSSDECKRLTTQAIEFMQKLLERDAKKRMSAGQAMRHPWISEEFAEKSLSVIARDKLKLARRLSAEADHSSIDPEILARRESKLAEVQRAFYKGNSTGRRVSDPTTFCRTSSRSKSKSPASEGCCAEVASSVNGKEGKSIITYDSDEMDDNEHPESVDFPSEVSDELH